MKTLLGNDYTFGNSEISDLFKRIQKNRGVAINSPEDERRFFHAEISDLTDPFLFPGMDIAVNRILLAKEQGERVIIFGDYDVDGVSATALLVRFFKEIGIIVSYRLPHRVHDGYGMKEYFMDELKEKGVTLVVSVDCGTRDVNVIKHAKKLGIDVIVTDHHAVPEQIPEEVVAILNPKIPGSTYPFSGLSGSGVAFKLLHAVASKLFSPEKIQELLLSFIDFAALGTIADMMPLVGENRIIATLGLKQLSKSKSSGLRRLIIGKNHQSADIVGFHIGPRINAAGRMDSPLRALEMLIASDERMDEIIENLESLNEKRKLATFTFFEEAIKNTPPPKKEKIIFYRSKEIGHGIIGLLAGRLTEHFSSVAVAMKDEGKTCVGSIRAPSGFHLSEALDTMKDFFIAYGGHAEAAGFTIRKDVLSSFETAFRKLVSEHSISQSNAKKGKTFELDGTLTFQECNKQLLKKIQLHGPFGIGFPKPKFLIPFEKLPTCKYIGDGEKHLSFEAPKGYKFIAFGMGEYLPMLKTHPGKASFIAELDEEVWRGFHSISIQIKDIVLE